LYFIEINRIGIATMSSEAKRRGWIFVGVMLLGYLAFGPQTYWRVIFPVGIVAILWNYWRDRKQ
jgi:hypothetical protein